MLTSAAGLGLYNQTRRHRPSASGDVFMAEQIMETKAVFEIQPLTKSNILVVDDRPDGLLALEAVLACDQYNLFKASSGQEALKYALFNDFAVILLDVQMPEMDGFECARLLRGNQPFSIHTDHICNGDQQRDPPYQPGVRERGGRLYF